jgi:chromosome segregation ATPase
MDPLQSDLMDLEIRVLQREIEQNCDNLDAKHRSSINQKDRALNESQDLVQDLEDKCRRLEKKVAIYNNALTSSKSSVNDDQISIENEKRISVLARQVTDLKEELKSAERKNTRLELELTDTSTDARGKNNSITRDFSEKMEVLKRQALDMESRYNLQEITQIQRINRLINEKQSLENQLCNQKEQSDLMRQNHESQIKRTAVVQERVFEQQTQLLDYQFKSAEATAVVQRLTTLLKTRSKPVAPPANPESFHSIC